MPIKILCIMNTLTPWQEWPKQKKMKNTKCCLKKKKGGGGNYTFHTVLATVECSPLETCLRTSPGLGVWGRVEHLPNMFIALGSILSM
jgi:hypothetical protein